MFYFSHVTFYTFFYESVTLDKRRVRRYVLTSLFVVFFCSVTSLTLTFFVQQGKMNSSRSDDPMVMHHWSGPRAFTRYESWDPSAHGQYTGGKESEIKEVDPWEIPRHHVRVCSILGEGSFGQVWKCEAYNVPGETIASVRSFTATWNRKHCRISPCTRPYYDIRCFRFLYRVQGHHGGRG